MSADTRRACRALIVCAFALVPCLATAQDKQIFEPGKKHVCVPSADRRSWNCGDAENPPAAVPRSDGPTLRSARATDLTDSERAAAAAIADPPASQAPSSVAAPAPATNRNVPNYLLAPESASAPSAPAEPQREAASAPAPVESAPVAAAPATPPAAEPETAKAVAAPEPPPAAPVVTEAKPPEPERVVTQAKPPEPEPPTTEPKARTAPPPASIAAPAEPPASIAAPAQPPAASTAPVAVETRSEPVVETRAEPVAAPKAEPAPAAPLVQAAPEPAALPPATPPAAAAPPVVPPAATLRGARELRTLADSRYVLELARGTDRTAVESAAAQASLPRGEVYFLTLTRDGSAWYVALWGDFDSIDSARAARAEALASGMDGVGWPRRVGPLKQELALVR
jgi:hypothetical protein